MREYQLVEVKEYQLSKWTCSICGRDLMDEAEFEEAFSFNQIGGYYSVFGDGAEITIDICQHCMKEKLGQFCTIV